MIKLLVKVLFFTMFWATAFPAKNCERKMQQNIKRAFVILVREDSTILATKRLKARIIREIRALISEQRLVEKESKCLE
jgi:hypothetical protein